MTSDMPDGSRYRLVVVGASLGGLDALRTLLAALPADFPLPVAIVQHVAEDAPGMLAGMLGKAARLPVFEPEDKDPIEEGHVYIAPPGYHLLVERDGTFALSADAPELFARPSIDVLFESAAEAFGPAVIGVTLTASSTDGAQGLAAIKRRGGLAIVQTPESAESPILPRAALAATRVDHVVPLREIGPLLARLCQVKPGVRGAA